MNENEMTKMDQENLNLLPAESDTQVEDCGHGGSIALVAGGIAALTGLALVIRHKIKKRKAKKEAEMEIEDEEDDDEFLDFEEVHEEENSEKK